MFGGRHGEHDGTYLWPFRRCIDSSSVLLRRSFRVNRLASCHVFGVSRKPQFEASSLRRSVSPCFGVRYFACLLLTLTLFFPQRASAWSFTTIGGSVFTSYTEALIAGLFDGITLAGNQFENGLLYEIYSKLDDIFGATSYIAAELFFNHDFYSDFANLIDYSKTTNNFLSTIHNVLERSNVALQGLDDIASSVSTIGGYLHNGNGSIVQAAQSALSSLPAISGRLSSSSHIGTTLTNTFNRLGTIISSLSKLDSISSGLTRVYGRLGADSHLGVTATNTLDAIGSLASLLKSDSHIGSSLTNIFNRLVSVDDDLGTLGDIYARLGADSHLGVTATNILRGIGSVIDGIDSGSTSVVNQLATLPGILQSGFSSVVNGIGAIDIPSTITAVLSPDAAISADTDVAGEAAQSSTLWDSIVGDVDTAQIQSQMEGCVGVLRTSFPFGLIFVVVDTFQALNAAPAAPVFECDLPSVSGTYHAVLDLSFFDSVAALFRGAFVVLYVFGLYSVTKSWVFNAGGDSA